MLNIEMLMEELEDETKMYPPPERKREVERILDDYDPNALIELAEAPEDIQERIKELDDEKLDEILDTPNLDGIYIGPADLSLALGEEPGFDKSESTLAFKEITRILEAAKKRNLLAGIHNGSVEYAQKMISKGFNLVTVGSDQRFMSTGARSAIEKIKGTKKGAESKGY